MNLNQFIEKYKGKKIDYDERYGAQCVDVFRQYCKDVLEIPHTGGVVGAHELYSNYEKMPLEKRSFERIAIDTAPAQDGDVVIFKPTQKNKFGHVAIVISAERFDMTVFEQDGFAQTGAYIQKRSYAGVLGFLRARNFENTKQEN